MGHTIIRGNSHEEMFASADKALSQLERRIAARSIVAPLTPIVIMGYCGEDDNGVIFRGLFPLSGFITKVSLHIEKVEDAEFVKKNNIKFRIECYHPDGDGISKEIQSRVLSVNSPVNFKISANSRVVVSVNTKIYGIWYGFIMEPEVPIRKKVDVDEIELLAPTELAMIEG